MVFKKSKIIPIIALSWSLLFGRAQMSSSQSSNSNKQTNDTYTIFSDSSTEIDFYNEKVVNDNGNLVRLGSGEIIGLSNSITSRTMQEAVLRLRAGDERLIRSIVSKVSESEWDIPSINKILQQLIELSLKIGSNDKLMRILAELEKPTIFVDGWIPQLPRHRNQNAIEKHKFSTPSSEFLLDATKCYGHREGYNMPRSVSEKFEKKAVRKVAKTSLKNPRVKSEYKTVQGQLEDGIHPVNLSEKSTFVSSTKVLVKKNEGRYLVDVSDTHADILGLSSRTNQVCMRKFEKLMNELYDLNLKGY